MNITKFLCQRYDKGHYGKVKLKQMFPDIAMATISASFTYMYIKGLLIYLFDETMWMLSNGYMASSGSDVIMSPGIIYVAECTAFWLGNVILAVSGVCLFLHVLCTIVKKIGNVTVVECNVMKKDKEE
jgi:hypothetical protein